MLWFRICHSIDASVRFHIRGRVFVGVNKTLIFQFDDLMFDHVVLLMDILDGDIEILRGIVEICLRLVRNLS